MLQKITIDVKCKISKIPFETPATAMTEIFFFLKSWGKLAGKNLKMLEFLLEQWREGVSAYEKKYGQIRWH